MSTNHSGPPRAPDTDSGPETRERHSRYLSALASLGPHLAHDFRARLGAATIHLDLAAELLAPGAPVRPDAADRVRAELARATEELHRLPELLAPVLELARLARPGSECFDLRAVLDEIARVVRPAATRKRIEWAGHSLAGEVFVEADREALRQGLVIALVEALDALAPGDRLVLVSGASAAAVEVTITSEPATAGRRAWTLPRVSRPA